MSYPKNRLRRLRSTNILRQMVQETELSLSDLIYPMFVTYGKSVKEEIPSMPDCYRLSIDEFLKEARKVYATGIRSFILFGIPEFKDEKASGAYASDGIIQQSLRALKDTLPDILAITDVCLCEYMSHGHCGIVKDGHILNDPTLELLAQTALSHVQAGADMVAPSDMMDGRVGAIRKSLDSSGFKNIPLMSYSAKYCSAFYGPFRDAAQSAPQFGDRATYQMNVANRREALAETALDIEEGADIVMVKPALSFLDIISDIKNTFNIPVAAYNVSGEYSMVKAAAKAGWIDEKRVMMEILLSIKRAGADIILTYFAPAVAKELAR
jgi:porphobilinogen synthase